MAGWPVQGSRPWGTALRNYIDAGDSFVVVNGGTVTLDDSVSEGSTAGYMVKATATFTSAQAGSSELEPGVYTLLRTATGWDIYATEPGLALGTPPDTTPPSAITDLIATGGEGELTYNWTASTDSGSAVKYGVKVWEDSDTEPSTYTIRTAGGPVTVTGLTAGTYNVKVYAFSTGGSTTPDTATATVTAPPLTDTMTGTNGTLLTAHVPDNGSTAWAKPSGSGVLTLNGAGKAVFSDVGGGFTQWTQPLAAANASASVEVTYTNTGDVEIGPAIRMSGGNYLVLCKASADLLLVQSAGGISVPGTVAMSVSTNDVIRLTLSSTGSAITGKAQRVSDGFWLTSSGTWQASAATAITTSVALTAAGDAGIMAAVSQSNGCLVDNFTAAAL